MGIFDDKKTLLEQRWEAEEPDTEVDDNPYPKIPQEASEEPTEEHVEYQSAEDEEVFMSSPLCDEQVPLVLITCNNRIFIGGLLEVMGDGVVLDHPMVYVEIPDQRQQGRLSLGVQKVFHGLPVPQNMWLKHDALNMIRKDSESAQRLLNMYMNAYEEVSARDAGIEAPSVAELRQFSKKEG